MNIRVGSPVRWGILATGRIAASFARDLQLVPGHVLTAVGSRSLASAEEFARAHGAARAHGSYAALAADPDIDVVYVATPHSRHLEDVMTCFEAGTSVLCEKALTMNADDSARLVAEARSRGLFFAEAMWMRTNPAIRRAREMVRDGNCGQVALVHAELGFAASPDVARLWDPDLGASALLDVGIYAVTFAHLMLGEPSAIRASGTLSDRGIDVTGGATLTYPGGAIASVAWSQVGRCTDRASVSGSAGLIEVPARFHHPDGFSFASEDEARTVEAPRTGRGYAHEIEEVGACLRDGRTESALLPLDETVSIMRQLDEMLAQIGVAAR